MGRLFNMNIITGDRPKHAAEAFSLHNLTFHVHSSDSFISNSSLGLGQKLYKAHWAVQNRT